MRLAEINVSEEATTHIRFHYSPPEVEVRQAWKRNPILPTKNVEVSSTNPSRSKIPNLTSQKASMPPVSSHSRKYRHFEW